MATVLASPTDPLGYDALIDDTDLDPMGRDATGVELVEAAIFHRLTCEQLLLIDAPGGVIDFGINVLKWVGEVTTIDDAAAKSPLVDEALHRDPCVASTAVQVTLAPPGTFAGDGSEVAILISVQVTTITGQTISRVVAVSAISVSFLAGPT